MLLLKTKIKITILKTVCQTTYFTERCTCTATAILDLPVNILTSPSDAAIPIY